MTCKDCIHCEVCDFISITNDITIAKSCDHFKNKADYAGVKRGEWFVKEFSYSKFITCSVCNSVIDSSYTNIDENEFDYCPYCGAKMDGRRDT